MVPGLAPIAVPGAKVLVLGTFPGEQSLKTRRYYDNPRNGFWAILEALLGMKTELDYDARISMLSASGLAVWDVLSSVERKGSRDEEIVTGTEIPNDFSDFFERHREIQTVFFNGRAAEKLYQRLVQPALSGMSTNLALRLLPSSSSACTIAKSAKIEQWRAITDALAGG